MLPPGKSKKKQHIDENKLDVVRSFQFLPLVHNTLMRHICLDLVYQTYV